MQVRFKKLHPDAKIPTYAKIGDGGMDITAISSSWSNNYVEYQTGLSIEIPEGYVGLIFPRSSISKTSLVLANSVGVIDSGFRGEITFRFRNVANSYYENNFYQPGDRIGQIVIVPFPQIEAVEVIDEELTETERGTGGYGSSGS